MAPEMRLYKVANNLRQTCTTGKTNQVLGLHHRFSLNLAIGISGPESDHFAKPSTPHLGPVQEASSESPLEPVASTT